MPRTSNRLAPRKAVARSRVSNGTDVLPGVDGRSLVARRYRDIAAQIIADMGGIDRCSEAKLQLVRRFSAVAVLAEQMEARLARGETVDVAEFSALASTAVRIAQRIGLERRARDVTPSLRDYLEHRTSEDAA